MFRRFSASSFRRQLTQVSAVGILVLALAISLVTSGVLARRLEALLLDYLVQLTEQLGTESVFAFLSRDRDVARTRVARIQAFPGVCQAALLEPNAGPLVGPSEAGARLLAGTPGAWRQRAALAGEDRACWHFAAPVRTHPLAISPLEARRTPELLGYIYIAWEKAPLFAVRAWLVAVSGVIALAMAALAIGWLQHYLRRLTDPLSDLAGVMQRMRGGEEDVRATVTGPVEIREIGRAFNELMARLERHRAALEAAVEIRTLELREARDAALTAARYKSEFMAAMTHEMRTPLQSIIGYTQTGQQELQFLENEADPVILGSLSRCLRIVLGASDELLSRINQVLDLAALEAGRREVTLERVDLSALLDQVVSVLKPLAERNHNRVEVVREGLPQVKIDRDKLRQIVRNLLDNACKFTHDGTVRLHVCAGNGVLAVEVTDSGIGIPADQLDLIFEPFRQVDMSDTRRYGGTGLGLAIARNVCRLLGGTLTVTSTLGQGSCFRVVIPLPVAL